MPPASGSAACGVARRAPARGRCGVPDQNAADRSAVLGPVLGRLRRLDVEETLELPFGDVVSSLAHMAVNRLLKRGGNVDPARVHHGLARVYEADIARERSLARDSVER